MPTPTFDQLKTWARRYVELWNAGDKDAWVENWRSVAPGKFRMLDPVGTPQKVGFAACALEPWDLFQQRVRFKIADGCLFINGNEVAWLLENHLTVDGKEVVGRSIETYRFEEDGSVVVRTYYKVPPRAKNELGEMFQEYLPE
ncbi:MAG: hypothetical protein P8R42_05685 [Candidatus Binatia bacterium]|nr:hypothetical protein [Candidatus Binatia bacterium]